MSQEIEPVRTRSSGADAILLGCVKSKRPVAAPAKDLYRGALFDRRRKWAERSGLPWFIVSARWGLVKPDEVIAPYDVHLADQSQSYRRAWGHFVVEQLLETSVIPASGSMEVHAGQPYVVALREALGARGFGITDPVAATSMGDMLSWYDRQGLSSGDVLRPLEQVEEANSDKSPLGEALARLASSSAVQSVTELRAGGMSSLGTAGLYSWWVDDEGALDLSRGLDLPFESGLIYAGQAGATRWPSGRRSDSTLRARLIGMHVDGNAEFPHSVER